MFLRDLHPIWLHYEGRSGIGLIFDCPKCGAHSEDNLTGHCIGIRFSNPLDGGAAFPDQAMQYDVILREYQTHAHAHAALAASRSPLWGRQGDTFDSLSLTPSINAYCWHGFVTNGEIITV